MLRPRGAATRRSSLRQASSPVTSDMLPSGGDAISYRGEVDLSTGIRGYQPRRRHFLVRARRPSPLSGLRGEESEVGTPRERRSLRPALNQHVKADALRPSRVRADAECGRIRLERNERLFLIEPIWRHRENQPQLVFAGDDAKIGDPRVVGTVVPDVGRPRRRERPVASATESGRRVPRPAMERLHHLVFQTSEPEEESGEGRVRHRENVLAARREADAVAIDPQDQAALFSARSSRIGMAALASTGAW
jgi:hypothetical protein